MPPPPREHPLDRAAATLRKSGQRLQSSRFVYGMVHRPGDPRYEYFRKLDMTPRGRTFQSVILGMFVGGALGYGWWANRQRAKSTTAAAPR